ncbi:phosphate ABC transporter permease PstA [Budviciaceae bacterium BWR-B9]|uniref:Phosphate transport system permease protein PstA n=1 Tax=Limnobaculum allomyrinae TaxID=2791986 RepID=A0ABS1IKR3_9GAMM|nr:MULTISPECIES: phosphate ABC transporter permease PstA [Limnobaculum]MBK5142335.1 phosphate ABC transporter permease PstA [Limnobaculum allomyrinae]MBV7690780.1 phosphate ABC transporter permease PstA [Limnobaculum sp. M2-1]
MRVDRLTVTFNIIGWLAVLLLLLAMGCMLGFLLIRGLPTINLSLFFGDVSPKEAILGLRPVWDGIWPACVGTLHLVCLTVAIALFPGIGCGIYLAEYANERQKRWLGSAIDILAGIPSIVMGLFGFTLILFLRYTFLPHANTGMLLAAVCLALLILPSIVLTTREALNAIPEDLRLTCAALGFSRRQRLRHILLPAASRGILGGIMLAFGRAAEDTAVILLTGVVANAGLANGIFDKFQALPFTIYYTAAQYQTQEELQRGFGAALILLLLAGGLLLSAYAIERTYHRRWKKG